MCIQRAGGLEHMRNYRQTFGVVCLKEGRMSKFFEDQGEFPG